MRRLLIGVLWLAACAAAAGEVWARGQDSPEAESPPPGTAAGSEEENGDEGQEAEEPEKEPRTVNLIIQGEEPDRWNLDLGGGWNENDGLYGRVALWTRNFLGRGEALRLNLEHGDEHELYELEYRWPFLFGRRQSFGVRLFHDATDHPVAGDADFGRRRDGGTLTYGRRVGAHQAFDLEYRFADVDDSESLVASDGETLLRRQTYVTSSIRPRWVWDSLDSRVSPFRGLRASASVEVAGGVFGGDSEIVKPVLGLTWFQPVRRHRPKSTFSLRARLGWLDSPDGEVFPQQRFFLGGEDSVRGFRRHSITALSDDGHPATDADGFPLGGDKMAQVNLEVHLLLGERFRLVFFADAGGVYAKGRSFDFDSARKSAGAELRVSLKKLPVPLRLIWAENLDPLPDDRFRDLSLSFGVSF